MPDITKLLSAIDAYAEQAIGADDDGELSRQRALALDAYQGKNIEPAPEGRSQVIDWSVFETVQWILPSLLRIFAGGNDIVEFEPTGPEDEDVAKQESDVLNYLVTQKNNWFMTCLVWFLDCLITKNAYCLAYMEEKLTVEVERYEGQSEDQVALLMQDDLDIVGQEQYVDEDQQGPLIHPINGTPVQSPEEQQEAEMLYGQFGAEPQYAPVIKFNIEVRHTKAKKRLKLKVLPPEHCLVDADTPDFTLADANYFEFFEERSISDLRKEGYEVADDIATDEMNESVEDTARDEPINNLGDTDIPDPAMRMVKVRTIWVRHDYDEDGIAELQRVVRVGNTILGKKVGDKVEDDIEPASQIPVACVVPFVNSHRHQGMSIADLTFDIQRIKTAMLRSGLDSLYLANNPRTIASKKVSLDDLLISRPGGVIRVDTDNPDVQGHAAPLVTENTFPYAQQGLEHMDRVTEARVGVSRQFQGIDLGASNDHNRIGQLSTMAAQRVEMIARILGNGVERLFSIAHELVIKSGHSLESIKLRGQWVNIDPTQWRTGRDMRVVAPFAAGNKDSLLQRFMVIAGLQEKALMAGLPIADASDAYELALDISQAADVNGQKYFTDPTTVPPKEPPPDYTMMALEIEKMKAENQAQDSQTDAQVSVSNAELKARVDEATEKLRVELEMYKVESNKELQIQLAGIKAGQSMETEKLRAQLRPKPPDRRNEDKALRDALNAVKSAVEASNKPKKVVRDDKGSIVGVEST